MVPSSLATRWRGPQPVRAQADPDVSKAEKNAGEMKGWYRKAEATHALGAANVSRPFRLAAGKDGLAQASQSSAGISPTEGSDSRVISDDAIDSLGPATRYDQPSHMVTTYQ